MGFLMHESFEEGMALRSQRRLKAALGAFERAVDEEPRSAQAWFWLAATLDNRAEESLAIPAYERALRLGLEGEGRVKALAWLASSRSKVGDHRAAMAALSKAEASGGYRPIEEFQRIAKSVRRRSETKSGLS